jgi:glutamine synthetase type III
VQHTIISYDSSFWEVHSQNCYHVHFLVPPPHSQQNHLQHSGNTKVNIVENKIAESVANISDMRSTQQQAAFSEVQQTQQKARHMDHVSKICLLELKNQWKMTQHILTYIRLVDKKCHLTAGPQSLCEHPFISEGTNENT